MLVARFARAVFLFLLVATCTPATQLLEDESWVAKNERECTEQLLQRPEEDSDFYLSRGTIVTVRFLGECEIESQITVFRTPDGGVEAWISLPRETSISDALLRLHRQNRSQSAADACSRIEMHSFKKAAKEVPEISDILVELEEMEVPPVLEQVMFVHGEFYDIWITSGGNHSYFRLQGPSEPDQPIHALQAWARRLLKLFEVDCQSLSKR